MKNRAFLSILEQLCMILIFAVVAAVCLRVFSLANEISKDRDRLDRAVITAQYTAELLKSSKGDLEACADALAPVRSRFTELMADKAYLEEVMKKGADEASYYARKTMSKVRRKIGFVN